MFKKKRVLVKKMMGMILKKINIYGGFFNGNSSD